MAFPKFRVIFLILASLLLIACPKPLSRYPKPLNLENLTKTVYIDKSFTDSEENDIINAMKAWECKTNYKVKFNIVLKYSGYPIVDTKHSLLIRQVNSTNELIVESDKYRDEHEKNESKRYTVGLYHETDQISEILMVEDRLTSKNYKSVAMHEVGHALGLDHNPNTDTIMYKHADQSATYITSADIDDFCMAYRCVPERMLTCERNQ